MSNMRVLRTGLAREQWLAVCYDWLPDCNILPSDGGSDMSGSTSLLPCTDVHFRANADAEGRKEMMNKMRNCRQQ